MRRKGRISLVVAATILALMPSAGQSQPLVEVNLGLDSTIRGDLAHIPILLFGTGVGGVRGEITFPQKVLSFDKVTRGQSGDEADVEVAAEVLNDSRESDLATLRVAVSATKEIPNGVLLDLRFRVSPDAAEGTFELKNSLSAMTLEGVEIKDVKRKDGEVNIFVLPAVDVTCFFFTH